MSKTHVKILYRDGSSYRLKNAVEIVEDGEDLIIHQRKVVRNTVENLVDGFIPQAETVITITETTEAIPLHHIAGVQTRQHIDGQTKVEVIAYTKNARAIGDILPRI